MGITVEQYMVAFSNDTDVHPSPALDGPASETQMSYLNDLGVPKSEASIMTRAEASAKIDERKGELAEVRKAQTQACTIHSNALPIQAHAVCRGNCHTLQILAFFYGILTQCVASHVHAVQKGQ